MKNSFSALEQNQPVTDFEYAVMIKEHLHGHVKELAG